jgi:hypothetical protein
MKLWTIRYTSLSLHMHISLTATLIIMCCSTTSTIQSVNVWSISSHACNILLSTGATEQRHVVMHLHYRVCSHNRTSECEGTFDSHKDRVWAMTQVKCSTSNSNSDSTTDNDTAAERYAHLSR